MANFNQEQINQVWLKGKVHPDHDPSIVRLDQCGNFIFKSQYGNRDSGFGWEIHHIVASSRGGSDHLSNLIPLQWENNIATGTSTVVVCHR